MIQVHEDINYVIKAVHISSHYVEYEIYALDGVDEGKPLYHKKDDEGWNPQYDIEKAALYCHGSVKWDGCSDWHFDEQDDCMLHGCSQQDLLNLGIVLARCWDWTAELLDNFDGETK